MNVKFIPPSASYTAKQDFNVFSNLAGCRLRLPVGSLHLQCCEFCLRQFIVALLTLPLSPSFPFRFTLNFNYHMQTSDINFWCHQYSAILFIHSFIHSLYNLYISLQYKFFYYFIPERSVPWHSTTAADSADCSSLEPNRPKISWRISFRLELSKRQ